MGWELSNYLRQNPIPKTQSDPGSPSALFEKAQDSSNPGMESKQVNGTTQAICPTAK